MKKSTGINIVLLIGVVVILGIGYYYFTRAVEEEVERPEVAIISPADGSVISQEVGIVNVNIRFTPPKAGKKERVLKVALNDIDITSDMLVGGGFARGWVPARMGQNVLKAEVDREEGAGAVSRFSVTIPPKAPEEPAAGMEETEEDVAIGEEEPEEEEEEGEQEPVPEFTLHPETDKETPPAFGGIIFQKAAKQKAAKQRRVEPAGEEKGGVIKKEEPGDETPSRPMFVSITFPADGSEVDRVDLPVRGQTLPELAVELYVSLFRHGREVLVVRATDDGGYEFSRVRFREGNNSVVVMVSNEAGNFAWAESNFRVELDADEDDEDDDEPPPCRFSVWIDCPERQAYAVEEEFICDINICFPDRNLMFYDMRISYDPGVVNLLRASGGDAGEFSRVVINIRNNPNPDTGLAMSVFNGVNNGNTLFESPRGLRINVAKLTFRAVGTGRSRLSPRSVGFWDTALKPVSPGASGDERVTVE